MNNHYDFDNFCYRFLNNLLRVGKVPFRKKIAIYKVTLSEAGEGGNQISSYDVLAFFSSEEAAATFLDEFRIINNMSDEPLGH